MNKNSKHNGPGRPKYQPVYPRTNKWSFNDFQEANGIDLETGKGANCSKLTLRKHLDRDMYNKAGHLRPNSLVMLVKGEFAPKSASGKGKRGFLFTLRSKAEAVKPEVKITAPKAVKTSKPKAAKIKPTAEVTVDVGTPAPVVENDAVSAETKSYEALKAELLAPNPAVVIPETKTEEVPATAETIPQVAAEPMPVA